MRVLKVVEGTSVDGPHLRTSIYFAGCTHQCPGCHNPQSWDPTGGEEMSEDELMRIIAYNEAPVTLSGGDPLFQADAVASLTARIKRELGYNIWCYTGYTWERIIEHPQLLEAVRHIDVLVDGPFIMAQRDLDIHFRGSRNQRIIDVPETLKQGKIIEIDVTSKNKVI